MREKISVYVDELFSDAALTIRNAEVQQEILQHTLDRYDDLIAAGKSEQEAYDEAVGGIGDVSELYEHKQAAEEPKKRDCAFFTQPRFLSLCNSQKRRTHLIPPCLGRAPARCTARSMRRAWPSIRHESLLP